MLPQNSNTNLSITGQNKWAQVGVVLSVGRKYKTPGRDSEGETIKDSRETERVLFIQVVYHLRSKTRHGELKLKLEFLKGSGVFLPERKDQHILFVTDPSYMSVSPVKMTIKQEQKTMEAHRRHNRSKLAEKMSSGILFLRRAMKKEDLCKIFLVYVCLFHVTPAHPCGENPLRRIISYSSRTGKDVNRVLRILQEANEEIFQRLEREWQMYANCVGMVDTGYFKRSSNQKPALVRKSQGIPEEIPEGIPKLSPWFLKMMFQVLKDSDHKLETDDSDLITDWLTRSLTSDIDDVVSRKQRG